MENLFSDVFLPATLAIITLGMGLSIEFSDIRNLFLYPKSVITGLLAQMLVLPAVAFVIGYTFDLDPVFKVGLIIIAACPGGATSNLVNFLLNGNVALSISITIINSIITIITIPFVVNLGLMAFMGQHAEIRLPVAETVLNIFIVVALPAAAGITIRHYFTGFAQKLIRPMKYALPMLILLVYLGVIILDEREESSQIGNNLHLIWPALLLNLLSMSLGWFVAYLGRLGRRNQFTVAVEVGLQNSALAIFVAAVLLKDQNMALIPVIYGSFSFFTTALYGYVIKTLSQKMKEKKTA
jgi:BASS family bile acid:Na+ symporter